MMCTPSIRHTCVIPPWVFIFGGFLLLASRFGRCLIFDDVSSRWLHLLGILVVSMFDVASTTAPVQIPCQSGFSLPPSPCCVIFSPFAKSLTLLPSHSSSNFPSNCNFLRGENTVGNETVVECAFTAEDGTNVIAVREEGPHKQEEKVITDDDDYYFVMDLVHRGGKEWEAAVLQVEKERKKRKKAAAAERAEKREAGWRQFELLNDVKLPSRSRKRPRRFEDAFLEEKKEEGVSGATHRRRPSKSGSVSPSPDHLGEAGFVNKLRRMDINFECCFEATFPLVIWRRARRAALAPPPAMRRPAHPRLLLLQERILEPPRTPSAARRQLNIIQQL